MRPPRGPAAPPSPASASASGSAAAHFSRYAALLSLGGGGDLERPEVRDAIEAVGDRVGWANLGSNSWRSDRGEVVVGNACDKRWGTGDALNALLDLLPGDLAYDLDLIVWLCDSAEEFPGWLYSALKRAQVWHGARVAVVVSSTKEDAGGNYVRDLRARTVTAREAADYVRGAFDDRLAWRGNLSLTDAEYKACPMPGFELFSVSAENGSSEALFAFSEESNRRRSLPHSRGRDGRRRRLSRHLRIMTTCKLADVLPEMLTDSVFSLKYRESCDALGTGEFLDRVLKPEAGMIAQIQYCDAGDVGAVAARDTASWNKAVANSEVFCRSADEGMDPRRLDAVSLLLFGSNSKASEDGREMVAVVLDPSFGFDLAKMFDERTSAPAAAARGGRAEMLEALQSRIPKWSENASVELLLQSPDLGQCGDVQDADCFEWPEWQLLEFLRRTKKSEKLAAAQSAQQSGVMTPSGEYVVLEAEELLKHFKLDTDTAPAACQSSSRELLRAKRKKDYSQDRQEWPMAKLQDCHGFHFNRCETSEEQDKEEARVQRMYVGVASETASTCNSLHSKGSKSNFVSKAQRQQPQQQPPSAPGSVKSVGASSKRNLGRKKPEPPPKRAASTRSKGDEDKDDVFKRKLRTAVYDALSEKGINEKSKLFRPCFKKLFDVVQMYGKEMQAAGPSAGTSKFLLDVARQNAEMTINLQRAILNNKQRR